MKAGRGCARVLRGREGVEAPPSVSPRGVADLERARIGETDNRSRMKSLPDGQTRRQALPGRSGTNDRGAVAGLDAGSEAQVLREVALQLRGIDAVAVQVH